MSLSTKLTALFLGMILLMGFASFYGISTFQSKILEREIIERMENIASSYLDKLDMVFSEGLDHLETLSADPVLSSKNSTPAQIQGRLEKFISRYPQFVSASFFDMKRTRIAHAGGGGAGIGTQHSLSEYWPEIYEGKTHIVDVSVSEQLHVPAVHFAEPIKDGKGTSFGVLVLRTPLEELHQKLRGKGSANMKMEKLEVDLLDQNGMVLYSNHNRQAILKVVDDDFDVLGKSSLLGGRSGSLIHVHGAGSQLGKPREEREILVFAKEQGYQGFKGNGWLLKIEMAASDAFAPIDDLVKNVSTILWATCIVFAAMFLLIILFMVIRPLNKLNDAAVRLGRGELGTKVAVKSADEIGRLSGSFNEMAANLEGAKKELERLVHIDPLTQVFNRRYFLEVAALEFARAQRYVHSLSVLMLDVDQFKSINDRHGHHTGDLVLQALCKTFQGSLREIDVIGRMGGEEFAMLLPETDAKLAFEVAERLRRSISEIRMSAEKGDHLYFTVSIGVAAINANDGYIKNTLIRADKALYAAKESGRNKVCLAEDV